MDLVPGFVSPNLGLGLLVARLVFGFLMAAHGSQKLFGWFSGYGLSTTGEFMVHLGFRPGRFYATVASTTEVVGGLLLALGLFGPVGPALMLSVMIVAAVTVHWKNGMWATKNGVELPLLYAAAAIGLALTGPGEYSLDTVLGLSSLWTPAVTWSVLAVGALAGVSNLALRRR